MKTIIVISSIFYILGLKIGNKIDLVKKSIPIEKIITIKTDKPLKCYSYNQTDIEKTVCDTFKSVTFYSDAQLKNKEF